MSNSPSDAIPVHAVAAGTFVAAPLDGRRTLCLKVERVGKEHVNHFLIPLDPLPDRRALALVYADPELPVTMVGGVSFAFADGAAGVLPEVGEAFASPLGVFIKVADRPQSQRLHAYVDLATGQLRPRMERHLTRLLEWSIQRI